MAEGWLRHLGGDRFAALSAGIEAHGKNPRAVTVMQEVGVDISGQASKILDPTVLDTIDLLVTVCGHADGHCPIVASRCRKVHWPFDDPAQSSGSEAQIMAEFRRVRDQIRARVALFIASGAC